MDDDRFHDRIKCLVIGVGEIGKTDIKSPNNAHADRALNYYREVIRLKLCY